MKIVAAVSTHYKRWGIYDVLVPAPGGLLLDNVEKNYYRAVLSVRRAYRLKWSQQANRREFSVNAIQLPIEGVCS